MKGEDSEESSFEELYQQEEVVWAKFRGYPWWPAYVSIGAFRSSTSMTMIMMREGNRRGTTLFSSGTPHCNLCLYEILGQVWPLLISKRLKDPSESYTTKLSGMSLLSMRLIWP